MGISRAMFFAYRSGRHPVSRKALAKLAKAESESGLSLEYLRDPDRLAAPLTAAAAITDKAAFVLGLDEGQKRTLFAIASSILTAQLSGSIEANAGNLEAHREREIKLLELREKFESTQKTLQELFSKGMSAAERKA